MKRSYHYARYEKQEAKLTQEELSKLTEKFLKKGGVIQVLEPDLWGIRHSLPSNHVITEFDTPISLYKKPLRTFSPYPKRAHYEP